MKDERIHFGTVDKSYSDSTLIFYIVSKTGPIYTPTTSGPYGRLTGKQNTGDFRN